MLKVLILSVLVASAFSVPEWQQCGGIGYNGGSCDSGLSCVYLNDYYSQCQKSTGQTTTTTKASSTTTKASSTTTKQGSSSTTTTKASSTTTKQGSSSTTTTTKASSTTSSNGKFPYGQFKVGTNFDGNKDYSKFDYISIWINTISSEYGTDYNPWYQREMIKKAKELNKMPLFYSYVIAFQARKDKNLHDCDMSGSNNLCSDGADYIRANADKLVERYKVQAGNISADLGSDKECIFVMEPDFWQYSDNKLQKNGGVTGLELRKLFDRFVVEIKKALPKARISWDISAWIGEEGMRTWWSNFATADIDYVHTSGGRAHGETAQIKPNELTWKFVSDLTGKKIIADCGYAVGGAPDPANCLVWKDRNNMDARVKDGVIALTASNLQPSDIPSYRPTF